MTRVWQATVKSVAAGARSDGRHPDGDADKLDERTTDTIIRSVTVL
ncbi:hypothetical protein [Halorientalis sp. IM1011]|nr:hypothetical protein [Halorientalis sp. IM1011]